MNRINISHSATGQPFDEEAYQRRRVERLNQQEGKLTGYDCHVCKNRGTIAIYSGNPSYPIYHKDCNCLSIRKCLANMAASGLKDAATKYTFMNYQTPDKWQAAIKAKAMDFTKAPSGWFVICGQSGAGKTHICAAISRELLMQGKQVSYAPWRDEIAKLKSLAINEGRTEAIDKLKNAEVLFLDDLFKKGRCADGAVPLTQADVDIAFEILNHRYVNDMLSIISTERTPTDLLKIDEALGGRIIEKAGPHLLEIKADRSRNMRLPQNSLAVFGRETTA